MNTRIFAGQRQPRVAFTLIELLVVVSIIALLLAVLAPSLARARNESKASVCRSNLHQLGLTVNYYTQDNDDWLPYIDGTPNPPYAPKAPFYQYHQLFNYWKYLKNNLKIYKCPSARGVNTVKFYLSPDCTNQWASYYTVFKADDRYLQALHAGWYSTYHPTDYPGPRVDPLYTEYWFNDWQSGAAGGTVPQISGGHLSKIPLPDYAVVMADAVWETKTPRHDGANQFVFLDAHVDKIRQQHYLDPQKAQDYDSFGNRPFYAWGLTKEGFNADP